MSTGLRKGGEEAMNKLTPREWLAVLVAMMMEDLGYAKRQIDSVTEIILNDK